MNPIGYRELIKLLKTASGLSGSFPAPGAKPASGPTWGASGYQLTFLLTIPLKAGRRIVGERSEWHTVTFGELSAEAPELYLSASYGTLDALRCLIAVEFDRAKRERNLPRVSARRAFWSGSEREATFTIKAGSSASHDIGGPVVSVHVGEMYLYLADFTFELAGRYGKAHWQVEEDGDRRQETDSAHFYYTFDPAAAAETSTAQLDA